jgi:methyl-accepting chemotaxis protein
MNWTISRKILAGYGISIALVVVICAAVFVNLQTLRDQFSARTKSHQKLDALDTLEFLLRDAETSSRGFIITGNESYLAPNTAAHTQLGPAIDRLLALAADDPAG